MNALLQELIKQVDPSGEVHLLMELHEVARHEGVVMWCRDFNMDGVIATEWITHSYDPIHPDRGLFMGHYFLPIGMVDDNYRDAKRDFYKRCGVSRMFNREEEKA